MANQFDQQQVPRPQQWEQPDLTELRTICVQPLGQAGSIADRLLNFLVSFRVNRAKSKRDDPERAGIDVDSLVGDVESFLRTRLDFNGSQSWEPHRMLGQGGFGSVGLWTRKSGNGVINDELVLKEVLKAPWLREILYRVNDELYNQQDDANNRITPLLNEAVIHQEMNRGQSGNIVHLRGYAYITRNQPQGGNPKASGQPSQRSSTTDVDDGKYHIFMEYAPYGNLDRLADRYRAWAQWLPEPFLWHVFDSLAQGVDILNRKPDDRRIAGRQRTYNASHETVHFDIKPLNVFLGYERLRNQGRNITGGSRFLPYPTVKLGDFGVSAYTHPEDHSNPRRFWGRGTPGFQPPEQTHYGVGFDDPPNGIMRYPVDRDGTTHNIAEDESRDPDPGFKFLGPANVWSIGKVMYDLATLSTNGTLQEIQCMRETAYRANKAIGNHLLSDFRDLPFRQSTKRRDTTNPYSPELMDLIKQCLDPRIEDRISIGSLRPRVKAGLIKSEIDFNKNPSDDHYAPGNVKRRKLYYQANDINNMPVGTSNHRVNRNDLEAILADEWDDPSWVPLAPPQSRWATHLRLRDQDTYRGGRDTTAKNVARQGYNVQRGRIWFVNPSQQPTQTTQNTQQTQNGNNNSSDDGAPGPSNSRLSRSNNNNRLSGSNYRNGTNQDSSGSANSDASSGGNSNDSNDSDDDNQGMAPTNVTYDQIAQAALNLLAGGTTQTQPPRPPAQPRPAAQNPAPANAQTSPAPAPPAPAPPAPAPPAPAPPAPPAPAPPAPPALPALPAPALLAPDLPAPARLALALLAPALLVLGPPALAPLALALAALSAPPAPPAPPAAQNLAPANARIPARGGHGGNGRGAPVTRAARGARGGLRPQPPPATARGGARPATNQAGSPLPSDSPLSSSASPSPPPPPAKGGRGGRGGGAGAAASAAAGGTARGGARPQAQSRPATSSTTKAASTSKVVASSSSSSASSSSSSAEASPSSSSSSSDSPSPPPPPPPPKGGRGGKGGKGGRGGAAQGGQGGKARRGKGAAPTRQSSRIRDRQQAAQKG